MIEHVHTDSSVLNFNKLKERIIKVNDPYFGKYNNIREMLYNLTIDSKPTLILATGGSKVIAYYLQMIIERLGLFGIFCEVIEPRDYFYKCNKDLFQNLIVISSSGKTNGIKESLLDFKGNKYLICEKAKEADYNVLSWSNILCDKEKSFISLTSSIGPMTLLLDSTTSLNLDISESEIKKINIKISELITRSTSKIDKISDSFKNVSLLQIMSGYETKTSSSVLESNLVETGLCSPVIHDKGSYCHGRSNLLFQYPDSYMIYLTHSLSELDRTLIEAIKSQYSHLFIFDTEDIDENIYWKEYYLVIQMYFLSKKIADDKNIDLTMPEYNPQLVRKLYNFKGEM